MKRIVIPACLSLLAAFSVASERLPVPQRGFVSSQPATTWEEGLICGNGTIGANALSRPLDERVIFSHGFSYPDYFVPAFDLTIRTQAVGELRDYARSVDFQTGEATVHWADVESLQWDGKRIEVTLSSSKSQTVVLALPAEIARLSVTGGTAQVAAADQGNRRMIELPGDQSVSMVIEVK